MISIQLEQQSSRIGSQQQYFGNGLSGPTKNLKLLFPFWGIEIMRFAYWITKDKWARRSSDGCKGWSVAALSLSSGQTTRF